MKTVKFILIALTGALLMLSACRNGGGKEPKPESFIEVTPTELHFTKKGGMQKLTLSTYDTWESSVDAYWCTISPRNGSKNATIEVTVDASTEVEETTAVIKFSDPLGNNVKVTVKRAGTGEKCKASDYPQVTIGTQVWMAENYRCSRYDTESEAYKEGRYIIPTSGSLVYTPYYTEVSDTSKWDRDSKKIYGVNLKDEQVAKLGYLYNWAAAVGVENGYNYGTQPFSGNRQGICPNGWHIPSRAEWQTLYDHIYKDMSLTSNTVGKFLKTTSGWYDEGAPQTYPQGLDSYGFAALPAGCGYGVDADHVGYYTFFLTATPHEDNKLNAYVRHIFYNNDNLDEGDEHRTGGMSVRCVKD